MRMLKGGPMGAVGTAKSFMNVVKDIDFEEARRRAEQVPSILVVAESHDLAQEATNLLFGEDDRNGVVVRPWPELKGSFKPDRYDVVIAYDPSDAGLLVSMRAEQSQSKHESNIVLLARGLDHESDSIQDARFEILELLPDMASSFGRYHPLWRRAAVNAIVDQTARANGQFALVSNIPGAIPVLGGMLAAGADLIVLTKNQVMMCYKIAAAHNVDLRDHMAILRELTPVVGAGFLWRTAAREAATFIPFAAGTIPKVTIAFAGTLAMGKAADLYYQHGSTPSRTHLARLRHQAMDLAGKIPALGDYLPATNRETLMSTLSDKPSEIDSKDDVIVLDEQSE